MNKIKVFLTQNINILLGISFVYLFYLNIITPLWGNELLAIGSLMQAEYLATFPKTIIEALCLRGYTYKILLYGFMNITDVFVDRSDFYTYQQVVKIIYYLFCFLITFVFIRVSISEKSTKQIITTFLTLWVIMFLSNYRQFMEAEELAVVFAVGHFLFIISNKPRLNYLSGIFLFLLFGCKTVTILYSGFGLLYLLIFEFQNRVKLTRVILSHLVFTLLSVGVYYFFLLGEIQALKIVMMYQGSLAFHGMEPLVKFFYSFAKFIPFFPMLIFIPIISILTFTIDKRNKILIFLFIAISAAVVILQNRFSSPYHYVSFLIIILYFIFSINGPKRFWLYLSLFPVLVYVIFQNHNHTKYLEYPSNVTYSKYFETQATNYTKVNLILEKNSAKDILFLTGDCPTFFIPTKSALVKNTAMILNRGMVRPGVPELDEYKSYYNEVLSHKGEFVLLDSIYLPLTTFPDIKSKLELEYEKVFRFNNTLDPKYVSYGEDNLILYKRLKD